MSPEPSPPAPEPGPPRVVRQEAACSSAALAEPIHTAVAGRARIRVAGLHRSPSMQDLLERGLAALPAVRSAAADPRTGNLLVLFDLESSSLEPVLARIAALVRGEVVPPPREAGRAGDGRPDPGGEGPEWHACGAAEVAASFGTCTETGLTPEEAQARLVVHGANALPRPPVRSSLDVLWDQFRNLPTVLLAGAAVVSLATGGALEAVAILGVVALNGAIGFGVENRSERTIRGLDGAGERTAMVLRGGAETEVPLEAVVPGDLIVLRRGTVVPADARVSAAHDLTVSEALLTGESLPVRKTEAPLDGARRAGLTLADRVNMVHRGTVVTGGGGRAIAVATGPRTEMGRIQRLVCEAVTPRTPMQRQLEDVGGWVVRIVFGVSAAVFGTGVLRGFGVLQMLRSAVSLAVAAVPEALPTVATTTLALGVEEMRRRDVLVRRLDAVETLASVGVVCFDKTGTLTLNRMSVAAVALGTGEAPLRIGDGGAPLDGLRADDAPPSGPDDGDGFLGRPDDGDGFLGRPDDGDGFLGRPDDGDGFLGRPGGGRAKTAPPRSDALARLLEIGVLCSEVQIEEWPGGGMPGLVGSATETALVRLAQEQGLDPAGLRRRHPRLALRQRTETYRFMASTHQPSAGGGEARLLVAVKGSPEDVLALCAWRLDGVGGRRPLTEEDRAAVLRTNTAMAGQALRVLGFAFRDDAPPVAAETSEATPDGLTWVGIAGLADPVRPGVAALTRALHHAGIRTVMMTGDQVATARAVARELGLAPDGAEPRVLDLGEVDRLTPEALAAALRGAHVLARVSPAQKLRVVRALQEGGEVVAMVGDGINDSPALKAADVGIAMGLEGTDAAREVADVVLRTDDLATLAVAIERGRATYGNVRRSIRYLLGTNLSEIGVVLAATASGFPEPLSVAQLLWINLITDILPGIGLALEPPAPGLMDEAPRSAEEAVLRGREFAVVAGDAAVISAGALLACGLGTLRHGAGPEARTMTFASLVTAQLTHALAWRPRAGAAGGRRPGNPALAAALGVTAAAQGAALVVPGMRRLLGSAPLGPFDIAATLAAGLLPYAVTTMLRGGAGIPSPPAARGRAEAGGAPAGDQAAWRDAAEASGAAGAGGGGGAADGGGSEEAAGARRPTARSAAASATRSSSRSRSSASRSRAVS
jgi:P-type Ca2+ transporter type 2C